MTYARITHYFWIASILGVCFASNVCAGDARLSVAEHNQIVEIYVGKRLPNGRTELVFELKDMHFISSQRHYGCIFVNGRIVQIREYNRTDSYVRGEADLATDDEEITAYSGVVWHPHKIDPHDHQALWKAFLGSPHKPFRGKLADRPEWWIRNPIQMKKLKAKDKTLEPQHAPKYERRRLSKSEMPEAIRKVLDPKTGQNERFYLVWSLATSGYTGEGAQALAAIACDRDYTRGTRGYAGMGLRNMSSGMAEEERERILQRVKALFLEEGLNTPHPIMRAMIAWGGADFIQEVAGEKLAGHGMEIEILKALPGKKSVERLWVMYEKIPKDKTERSWTQRWHPAAALVSVKDKRGIDVLVELLSETTVVSGQHRSNTFRYLARVIGRSFGYTHANYHPSLDESVPKMTEWWKANRESFEFSGVKRQPRKTANKELKATR